MSTGSLPSRPPLFFIPASDRDALLRPVRLCGKELSIALFDAAGPLVPGNRGADMVRASAFACSDDFLLRLAGCQGKNLIVEVRSCGCRPLILQSHRAGARVVALEQPPALPWSAWLRTSSLAAWSCYSAQAHARPFPVH